MARHVVLLHGWSATSESMGELVAFVAQLGRPVTTIHLGDYLSMQDDVRVEDAAKRMQAVVEEQVSKGALSKPFDLIVHSTGALVARLWLARSYPTGDGPVRNFLMLAPVNFGSRLAKLGRSMAARVYKTLFGDAKAFETGTEMLHALELASPFQWDLAQADLFLPAADAAAGVARTGVYRPDGVRPFIIAGTHPLAGAPLFATEPGSDCTVRVASANLNASGLTIDFSGDPSRTASPRLVPWTRRQEMVFPFAVVADRDHLSILYPLNGTSAGARKKRESASSEPAIRDQLAQLIAAALGVESRQEYELLADRWGAVSEATARLADHADRRRALLDGKDPGSEYFRQHYTVIVRARDDHGGPIPDYYVSFLVRPQDEGAVDTMMRWSANDDVFHEQVLRHVHTNTRRPDLRCFHVERNALVNKIYDPTGKRVPKAVYALVTAEARGDKVAYFSKDKKQGRGLVKLHDEQEPSANRFLQRWTSHLIEVVVPRIPDDDVFEIGGPG
jgi:hypothetical protein